MIAFSADYVKNRLTALENEVDKINGKPPRNKFTCTVCYGDRIVDEAFHGIAEMRQCAACEGGKLIDEANRTLI